MNRTPADVAQAGSAAGADATDYRFFADRDALVGIYDQLSPAARKRIPQRLYLWAVEVVAAQAAQPVDLTASARQLPPDPPLAP